MTLLALKQIADVQELIAAAQALSGVDLSALQGQISEVRLNFFEPEVIVGTAKWFPFTQVTVMYAYFVFGTPSTVQAQLQVKKNNSSIIALAANANAYKSNIFVGNAGDILVGQNDFLTVDITSVQNAKNLLLTLGYKQWQ